MFRIIAIETLEPEESLKKILSKPLFSRSEEERHQVDCYNSVMKVLKVGTFYLVGGFTVNNLKVVTDECVRPLSNKFYCDEPNITFSSIVGFNGDGKSSLIELIIRLMNNTTYVLRDGIYRGYAAVEFVPFIYARLYFEAEDGQYYVIEQKNDVIKFYDARTGKQLWKCFANQEYKFDVINRESRNKLSNLFYSIVVNYSAYAFNSENYSYETTMLGLNEQKKFEYITDNNWLNSIFDKNDGYQVPVVITPYRTNGNIDYAQERILMMDRLYYIVFRPEIFDNALFHNKKISSLVLTSDDDLKRENKKIAKKLMKILLETGLIKRDSTAERKEDVSKVCVDIFQQWLSAFPLVDIIDLDVDNNELQGQIGTYIAYKTIKIAKTYAQYAYILKEIKSKGSCELGNLLRDRSHITLKIRRCLALLRFGEPRQCKTNIWGSKSISVEEYKSYIDNALSKNVDGGYHWEENELYPAPVYMTDFVLRAEDNSTGIIRYSSLSSGEKQLLNVLSQILYHIGNVASVHGREEDLKYKNICILYDEIELYFHPQLQQQLVLRIRDAISKMQIEKFIKGIHVILSTHSPFILSDIPSKNVLCIKRGQPCDSHTLMGNTFAANVYDVLDNNFFMDNFVGDFAQQKIDDIVLKIKSVGERTSREFIDELRSDIAVVGDDFIRRDLLDQLREKLDAQYVTREELKAQISVLQEKLNKMDR